MFVEKLPGGQARLWGGLIEQHGDHAGEFTTPDPRQLDCGLIGSEPVQLGNSLAGPAFIAVDSSNQFVITTIDTLEIAHSHVTVYSGSAMDPDDADERAKRQGLGMLRNATTPGQWATYKYNCPDGSVQLRLVDLETAPLAHYTVFSHGPPPANRPDPMIVAPARGMPRVPGADPGRNLIYTGMYLSSGDKAPLQIVEIDVTCAALPTQTVIVSNSLHKPFGNPFMYRGKRHYICAGHARNDLTYNELHIYREPSAGQYWDRVQEICVGSHWVPQFRAPGQLHSPEPTVIPDADGNIVVAFNVQDRSTALSSLEFSGFGALAIAVVGKRDSVFVVRDPAPWQPIVEPELVVTPDGCVVVYFEKARNGRQLNFDDVDSAVYRVKLEPSNTIARKAAVVNSAYG